VFLVTSNFDVIKTYNDSTAYALSVALLGDAVKGGRPVQAQWPTHDPQLSEAQVRRLQAKLKTLGYEAGKVDGKIGDQIRAAVRAFQERNGLAPDGYPTLALLKQVSASRCPAPRDRLKPPSKEWRCGVSPALPAAPRVKTQSPASGATAQGESGLSQSAWALTPPLDVLHRDCIRAPIRCRNTASPRGGGSRGNRHNRDLVGEQAITQLCVRRSKRGCSAMARIGLGCFCHGLGEV